MYLILKTLSDFLFANASTAFSLAIVLFCVLAFLLSVGRRFEMAVRLERIGIPIALIAGLGALVIGPYGQIPLLPEEVTDIWVKLPSPLLTLVFASLMLGRPIPSGQGLWKPVTSQALLALLLGFGQYLVGGLVVLFFLIPFLGVDPLMGCLIEVGFEGGHGAAAIMGESYAKLGFPQGLDLGLAMATVGLFSSTVIGSALVVVARWRGWVTPQASQENSDLGELEIQGSFFEKSRELAINLAFAGMAVLLGALMLYVLRQLAPFLGGIFQEVILVFPVFPLALLGSLFIRYLLEKFNKEDLISELLHRDIATLSTDLLITTALASVNLPVLLNDWLPLAILSVSGLTWNLLGMFFVARYTFKEEWFERSIAEFGNATGVAASGILLLRLADPRNVTSTLPIFSSTRLFLQPFLSGGLVTVLAPIAITKFGLGGWTEVSGALTIICIVLILLMQPYLSNTKNK